MKMRHLLFIGLAAWAGMTAYRANLFLTPLMPKKFSGFGRSDDASENGGGIGGIGQHTHNSEASSFLLAASKNKETPSQTVALHKAAALGDLAELNDWIQEKYNINSRDTKRRTALMFAALNGRNEACQLLLSAGSNVRLRDEAGFSALDYAAGRGHADTVRLLLTTGAEDNHYLEYATLMQAAFAGDVKRIPQHGGQFSSVNMLSSEDQSPLMIAAGNGSAAVLEALIVHGADVNLRNNQKQTALHWAAWNNKTNTLEALLSHKARINESDAQGNTALMFAAQNGQKEAVTLLLSKGANRNAVDQNGQTAASMAYTRGHQDIANLLK
jgi:serine/threonine-protein phosphatase 6 regulatory ankyrin repeat subunit A/serine/threonine-protein phosphatase 6 regulatory ankyrin repeat subunit B